MVLLTVFWLALIIPMFVAVGNKLHWLDYLYIASYVKLAITLVKYVPQVSRYPPSLYTLSPSLPPSLPPSISLSFLPSPTSLPHLSHSLPSQVWFNFRRRSTEGWSIGGILLDFTGGILSILQMFLLSYNYSEH